MPPETRIPPRTGRSLAALLAVDAVALVVIAVLVALGVWQVHRRAWKLDLIERVEARIHAPPAALPPRDHWPQVTAASDEYRRVRVVGAFLDVRPAFVRAVTEFGGGFWMLAPLHTADGAVVLVNRGFVPDDQKKALASAPTPPPGPHDVRGLLRMSEPGGGFLRSNDSAADRWYSRDVAAIAAARGLPDVAPFFIDADKAQGESGAPLAGMTVLAFPNNHLLYAFTWFAMALLLAGGMAHVNVRFWKERRSSLCADP